MQVEVSLGLFTFLSHFSSNGGALFTSPEAGFVDDTLYSVFHVSRNNSLILNYTFTNSSKSSVGSTGHLAPGSIAGIIIGAIVGIIIALVLLFYLIRRHRMRKNLPSELPQAPPPQELPSSSTKTGEELWANEPAAVELPIQNPGIGSDRVFLERLT